MLKVGIIGATGYVGAELLRLLLNHPKVTIESISSVSYEGEEISSIYKNLYGVTNLICENQNEVINKCDVIFAALPHGLSEEIADLVCEEGIKVVTTGAGSPGKYMAKWKEHDIKVIPVVASVALAKRMEKSGADAIIAEGTESGGHVGQLTTMALVPQVVDAVSIPVIAAGGIGDGRGVAASFMLGSEGIQIGTRFLVAKECTVHQNYKDKVLKAKDIDTEVTGRPTGHPVRVLRNKLARTYIKMEKDGASLEELEQLGVGALRKAVVDGDVDNGSVMSGQIAGLVNKEQTAKEIIEELFTEAKERFKLFGGRDE